MKAFCNLWFIILIITLSSTNQKTINEVVPSSNKELLSIKKDDFKEFASWFREAMSSYNITVIGNTNKINENKDMFKTIRPLKK